ncbi:protein THEM6-like isoform X1 [Ixodes scapularis]|uniref:protein THEM6-like isoform X1 n=1 Tax=Ixodes scapularis TaxID=6945 RepID=UPI001A9E07B6|nr:protein THEM6-like isoform X1 [Ixodes scapularis]
MHWIVGVLFLLYAFVDVNYLIWYIILITAYALKWRKTARCSLLEPDCYTGISFPSDMDHLWHMNNAKYPRAFEYARAVFGLKSELLITARQLGTTMVMTSQMIRYRKPLTVFQWYRITTKVVFIEGRDIYVEQQLATTSDNFVHGTCMVKLTMTKGTVEDVLKAMNLDPSVCPKEVPVEVRHFIAYNEANSSRLNPAKAKES